MGIGFVKLVQVGLVVQKEKKLLYPYISYFSYSFLLLFQYVHYLPPLLFSFVFLYLSFFPVLWMLLGVVMVGFQFQDRWMDVLLSLFLP